MHRVAFLGLAWIPDPGQEGINRVWGRIAREPRFTTVGDSTRMNL